MFLFVMDAVAVVVVLVEGEVVLFDVREYVEWMVGYVLIVMYIVMSELFGRVDELFWDCFIVCICCLGN